MEALEDRPLLAPTWTPIGPAPQQVPSTFNGFPSAGFPVTGRVTAIAFGQDNTGAAALFLGTASGGVWESTNYTSPTPSWNPLTDDVNFPINLNTGLGSGAIDVGSITVDPFNKQTIYVGTGEANYQGDARYGTGILKSTDGGKTWQVFTGPNDVFFKRAISKIIVNPINTSILYASVVDDGIDTAGDDASDGIYRSTDSGATWIQVAGGNTLPRPQIGSAITVTDMDYTVNAQSTALTLYAGVKYVPATTTPAAPQYGGIYQSTDGGNTWVPQATTSGLPAIANDRRIALAANHTPGSSLVYAAIVQQNGSLNNVYSTTDGINWTPATTSGPGNVTEDQGWYALALALSPTGLLFIGGDSKPNSSYLFPQLGIWVMDPTTSTWTSIDKDSSSNWIHTDLHAFAFDEYNTLYVGTDGGIFSKGSSGFGSWRDLNTSGLQTNQINRIALKPTTVLGPGTNGTMAVGSQDNGFAVTTDGSTWNTDRGGDGEGVQYDSTGSYLYSMQQYGQLSYSSNDGQTWSALNPPGNHAAKGDYPFDAPFALDPLQPNQLIVGAKAGVIWNYNGSSWVQLFSPLSGPSAPAVTSLAFSPSDDNVI
jgi:photosystem II stability/assembly factor-like uncharacterized protein